MLDRLDDSRRTSLQQTLSAVVGICFFIGALLAIRHQLQVFSLQQVTEAMGAVRGNPLFWALLLTACGYALFCCYDLLALACLDRDLPFEQTVTTSFVSYAFSNNVGLAMLGGTMIRYRLYSAWGLSIFEITKIVSFCALTFWLGFLALSGLAFVVDPLVLPAALVEWGGFQLPFTTVRPIGIGMLVLLGGLVFWLTLRRRPLSIRGFQIRLPSTPIVGGQILVAGLELMAAAGAAYVLIAQHIDLSYGHFLAIFLLALVIGLISHVPGGLGVFETVILATVPTSDSAAVLGGLVVFRLVYYILPLILATLVLAWLEWHRNESGVRRAATNVGDAVRGLAPTVLSAGVVVAGLALVVLAVVPVTRQSLHGVARLLPMGVVDVAHVLTAMVGVSLMLVARGLHRRLAATYRCVIALLVAGVTLALVRGGTVEEIALLSGVLIALLPCGRAFYRRTGMLDEPLSIRWLGAVTLMLGGTIWIGAMVVPALPGAGNWWTEIGPDATASRFLRASIAASATLVLYALTRMLQATEAEELSTDGLQLADATPILLASDRADARLLYQGDLAVFFAEDYRSMLMYDSAGKSWVTLGDPIGPVEAWPDLLWRFHEAAETHHGRPVFYQVRPASRHLYHDLGMTSLKLASAARVDLRDFDLKSPGREALRERARQLEHDGVTVSIFRQGSVGKLRSALRGIAARWEEEGHAEPRAFGRAFFDRRQQPQHPVALLRLNKQVVGFGIIWTAAAGTEVAVDIVRLSPLAPAGAHEYLLTQVMLWGKHQGYSTFNLGSTPLPEAERRHLPERWTQLGCSPFVQGEHIDSPDDLIAFKQQFQPVWEPSYLVLHPEEPLHVVIDDLAALIQRS